MFPEGRNERGGWFRAGDAGYLKDGYLFINDRIKDMIISGGENIYPAEIENLLMKHPAVADGAIIGVPDPTWGEAVKACVVLKPGQQASERELIDWMRERLAHFKCPKTVDFVDALPRNPSGKLLKRLLREPYWAGERAGSHDQLRHRWRARVGVQVTGRSEAQARTVCVRSRTGQGGLRPGPANPIPIRSARCPRSSTPTHRHARPR